MERIEITSKMRAETYEMAVALYDAGWRHTDNEEMIAEYNFTEEEAETICKELESIEEEVGE